MYSRIANPVSRVTSVLQAGSVEVRRAQRSDPSNGRLRGMSLDGRKSGYRQKALNCPIGDSIWSHNSFVRWQPWTLVGV